jgi:hypothetical protein
MKTMTYRWATLLLILFGMVGCATPKWEPTTVGGAYVDEQCGYSIALPDGWSWVKMSRDAPLIVTRDGPGLQAIRVHFREHRHAFPHIEERSSADMLPQELAELLVAEFKAEHGSGEVELLGDAPVRISDQPGFRIEFAWREANGLRYRGIVYGVATERGFYFVSYMAPVLNYFAQHEGQFEQAVQTFRLPS